MKTIEKSVFVRALLLTLALGLPVLAPVALSGCSGTPSPANAQELMCQEHNVPERFCTVCHPELKSKLLMCDEHGVPEEICTICHPEVIQKFGLTQLCEAHKLPAHLCPKCNPAVAGKQAKADWCPLHGVPRSLCTRCDPALANTLPMCAEHGVPEALCTICRPELAANFVTCKLHHLPVAFCANPACQTGSPATAGAAAPGRAVSGQGPKGASGPGRKSDAATAAAGPLPLVRLAGPDVARKAGIEAVEAVEAAVTPTVTATGEVAYDDTRLARVRPRVSGIVREVRVKPGEAVRAGELLARIDSADLGQAKADYLAARPSVELGRQTFARNRGLCDQGIIAGKQLLEAEAALRRAEAELLKASQRLRNFGLDSQALATLAEEDETERNQLAITAPLDGTVVSRSAVVGEAVEPATELFTVADVSRVWIHLDLFEADLRQIHAGQAVIFRVSALAPAEFPGKVAWIDSQLNRQTRTIRVRVEAENRDGLLRANMFGRGEIQAGRPRVSLVVPRDALQWEGSSYVVFVEQRSDRFQPRRVLIGHRGGAQTELAWADLTTGERVVTAGSFLLKTEIQKGSIGAGCCGD